MRGFAADGFFDTEKMEFVVIGGLGTDVRIWIKSLRRTDPRRLNFESTFPNDATHAADMAALDAALPTRLNIVGNAASLLRGTCGKEIDALPTIRFNFVYLPVPEAQGNRIDFIATSNGKVLRHLQTTMDAPYTLIFTRYQDRQTRMIGQIDMGCPVLHYPMRLSISLMQRLNARPSTGTQILALLDQLGRRDVTIFGFDWKATQTFYTPNRRHDPHNYYAEKRLVRKIVLRNGWSIRA